MAIRRRRSDVGDWAASLSPEQLLCRDLGHTWGPWRAYRDAPAREFVQVLRCSRCETERVRRLDYTGHPTGGTYAYAEGYLAPKGSGYWTADGRADLRLVSLEALIDDGVPVPDEFRRGNRKAS